MVVVVMDDVSVVLMLAGGWSGCGGRSWWSGASLQACSFQIVFEEYIPNIKDRRKETKGSHREEQT